MSDSTLYWTIYRFGVTLGLRNLARNGFRLGVRKTLGKILQPINSYTRYPEYAYFVRRIVRQMETGRPIRLLDVGSPKLLGLWLAYHHRVHVVLTDYSREHLDEYVALWDCLAPRAHGTVRFQAMDARRLPLNDESFDIVYSMSVVEHIDVDAGDRLAVREMVRVLRRGGLLLVSVPFGTKHVRQYRHGFSYNEPVQDRNQKFFFQKIYDQQALQSLLDEIPNGQTVPSVFLIRRRRAVLIRAFLTLGIAVRGVLGCLNPLLAMTCCESEPYSGQKDLGPQRYTDVVSSGNFYPDVVVSALK